MTVVVRRRAARPALWLVLVVMPAALAAQPAASAPTRGVVKGIVYDSLLGQPLAGASVWVDGAAAGATTDGEGRFVVAGVPAGRREVGATHEELDMAGIPTLGTSVVVPAGGEAEVTLATPTPATLRARLCAGEVARGDAVEAPGVVFGEVRDARTDARLAGATVTVTWMVARKVREKLVLRTPAREVRTDSLGVWYACGIPLDEEVDAWASAAPFESGRASVAVGRRSVTRFDLLVSREPEDTAAARAVAAVTPAAAVAPHETTAASEGAPRLGSAMVAGAVRDGDGRPYHGARITVEGAAGEARTDAEGRYLLGGLPAGTHTLVVRAIGYAPQLAPVGLRNATTARVDVTLRKVVTVAGVYVTARRAARARLENDIVRRERLGGHVLDSAALSRTTQLRTAMHQVPFTRTSSNALGDWRVTFNRRGRTCIADVWIDGVQTVWEMVQDMAPQDFFAVEVHRGDLVPIQYGGAWNKCGAVLLWTRWAR